jgi:Leucine-rich repeat (LRR) protein
MQDTTVSTARASLASLLRALPGLTSLQYRGRTEVLTWALEHVGLLPQVHTLILSGNGLFADSVQLLLTTLSSGLLPSLHTLDLRDNPMGEAGWAHVATALTAKHTLDMLQHLYLDNTHATGSGAALLGEALRTPDAAPRLRTLSLAGNGIDAEGLMGGLAVAFHLPHCAVLETLDLGDNPLTARGVEALGRAIRGNLGLPCLTTLRLGNTEMGPGGAQALGFAMQYGALSKLQTLVLNDNDVGTAGCDSLSFALSAGAAVHLTHLDLTANDIGASALPELCLALSSRCPRLTTLRLGYNPIGGDLGDAMRSLGNALRGGKTLPHLTLLDLSYADVDENGLRHLVASLLTVGGVATPLQSLYLSGNQELGREELVPLLLALKSPDKACPRLGYLEVRGMRPMNARDAALFEEEMGQARRGLRVAMGG